MEKIVAKKEWSAAIRINHWAMAIAIFVLIATGFYIATPFTVYKGETFDKFFMGDVRFWHILFGVFLTFIFIWRAYLAFFSRFHADWKDFFGFLNIRHTIHQVKFYALMEKEGPDYKGLYGPMQSMAYLGLMGMLFLIVVTGLILMGAGYHGMGFTAASAWALKPAENLMGGLATVRFIHHILTWCFILFVMVHIYMAFWYDAVLQKGTISSMVSGRVFEKQKGE
ncbi:MAG: Ni/Fe-hydrogenase, b-type cytochrome subunit [Syntrophaceae bacterium]